MKNYIKNIRICRTWGPFIPTIFLSAKINLSIYILTAWQWDLAHPRKYINYCTWIKPKWKFPICLHARGEIGWQSVIFLSVERLAMSFHVQWIGSCLFLPTWIPIWVKAWSPTVLSPLPKRSQRRWSPNQQTRKLRFSPSIDFSMALLRPYSIRTVSEWSPGILPVFLPGHDSMSHPMPRVVDLLSYWSVPPLILKMVAGGCQHGYRR